MVNLLTYRDPAGDRDTKIWLADRKATSRMTPAPFSKIKLFAFDSFDPVLGSNYEHKMSHSTTFRVLQWNVDVAHRGGWKDSICLALAEMSIFRQELLKFPMSFKGKHSSELFEQHPAPREQLETNVAHIVNVSSG